MLSAVGSPVAPGIIKHLRALGHEVWGHDVNPNAVGKGWLDKFFVSRHVGSEYYLGFIKDAVAGCDLYLPFIDEELRLFAVIEPPPQALVSPSHALSIFTSKHRQQEALERAGLPVAPRAHEPPAIVKPDYGRGGKGIMRTERQSDIDHFAMSPDHVCQKFIAGTEYTVDVLTDRDGAFVAAVPRKRLAANGFSTVGQIDMRRDAIEIAQEMTEKFDFVGPINVQMIDDGDQLWINEVNARLSGSCMFTVMGGFDILDATIAVVERTSLPLHPVRNGQIIRRHYVEECVGDCGAS